MSRRSLVYNKSSSICIPNITIPACKAVEKSVTKNLIIQSMEGKKIGQIQRRISRRRLVLHPLTQQAFSTCIPNMSILACMVIKKSLPKYFILQSMEGKKIGQIQERTNRRMLSPNPTIKQVVIDLHNTYEQSSMHDCGEIFAEKIHSSKY